jgi:hypothetical protein
MIFMSTEKKKTFLVCKSQINFHKIQKIIIIKKIHFAVLGNLCTNKIIPKKWSWNLENEMIKKRFILPAEINYVIVYLI